jgi:hypothetical protein
MLVAGGLFTGGAATFAWSRVPIWRRMPLPEFVGDFAQTLQRTDRVQPGLLVAAGAAAVGFALSAEGQASALAWLGAAAFVAVLAASIAYMVPLQRRIIASPLAEPAPVEELRARWFRGNLGRSVLATLAFVATVAAVTI